MAVTQYGYYIKGNKVAIVEKDTQFDNDVNSKDFGPGSNRAQWKSPLASVTDGLELEYVYSPDYILKGDAGSDTLGKTLIQSFGWFIDSDNYLNFLTTSEALDEDMLSAASGGPAAISEDEHFLVKNSSSWNGVHKCQSRNANGYFQTYTKVNKIYNTGYITTTGGDINIVNASAGNPGGHLNGDDSSDVFLDQELVVGNKIFITSAGSGDNGVYEVTAVTSVDGGAESVQLVYIGKKYFLSQGGDIDEIQTGDDHLTADGSVHVIKITYDPSLLRADVDVLDNEDDIIDISSYLSKALVYYVKARVAEDTMNIDAKEYFMKEFTKMVEKHNNTRVAGVRIQAAGPFSIR